MATVDAQTTRPTNQAHAGQSSICMPSPCLSPQTAGRAKKQWMYYEASPGGCALHTQPRCAVLHAGMKCWLPAVLIQNKTTQQAVQEGVCMVVWRAWQQPVIKHQISKTPTAICSTTPTATRHAHKTNNGWHASKHWCAFTGTLRSARVCATLDTCNVGKFNAIPARASRISGMGCSGVEDGKGTISGMHGPHS